MPRLPGAQLIEQGPSDLKAGIDSKEALLVAIGAPRLSRLGLRVPVAIPEPELRLYHLLNEEDPETAHSQYNALIRRLASYERAAACAS